MSYFETNFRAIKRKNPDFRLPSNRTAGQSCDVKTMEAGSGEITAMRKGILLHSKLDPRREAHRLVAGLVDSDCVVFFGFGLGYYVEEYLTGCSGGTAVVVEPDYELFRLALCVRDLTKVLKSPRFILILDARPEALAAVLNAFPFSTPGVLAPRSLVRFSEAYFEKLQAVVDSLAARREINRNTLKRFGRRWVRNLAANIRHLPAARKLEDLEGCFENVPALVLAAGPSIDRVLEQLPALAGRFLLFAVDTSMRAVLRAGVSPDFVVVVDPQYWNVRHLDGCSTEESILITESATYPAIFRRRFKTVYFGASLFPLGAALERDLGSFGKLGAGGSVATSAWDAARQMGCSPIFAAGLDLGYPGAGTHFKGGRFEEMQLHDADRFTPAETGNYRFVNDASPFLVESNSGGKVLTDRRLVIYKWWFENQLQMHTDIRCGNLSADGVRIEGMDYTPLADLLAYPVIGREARAIEMPGPNAGNSPAVKRKQLLEAAVSSLIDELESLHSLASRAYELTTMLHDRGGTLNEAVLENLNRIDLELLSHKAKDVAGFLVQDIAQEILEETRTGTKAEEIKRKSMRMYENLKESAAYHIDILERSVLEM